MSPADMLDNLFRVDSSQMIGMKAMLFISVLKIIRIMVCNISYNYIDDPKAIYIISYIVDFIFGTIMAYLVFTSEIFIPLIIPAIVCFIVCIIVEIFTVYSLDNFFESWEQALLSSLATNIPSFFIIGHMIYLLLS